MTKTPRSLVQEINFDLNGIEQLKPEFPKSVTRIPL